MPVFGNYLPGQQITRRSAYAAPNVDYSGGNAATYDAPAQRARAMAPMLSPATIAAADASQNDERQRQMRYENMGLTPRSPSPHFAAEQRGKIARGIAPQIGTAERPSLAPGERNLATGLTSADARSNNANFHSNSASMVVTDQQARAMYKTAIGANPGNLAAGQKQFHDTMAKYGVNGHALLDTWPRAPIMGPKAGYDPLPARDMIAPTARLDTNDQQYGNIRDAHQAPPSVAPSFTADSSSTPQYSFTDPDTLPQAASRSVPNMADEAIQAPVAAANAKAQGARDIASDKNASNERRTNATTQASADRNASQERQTGTRAAATTQNAGINADAKEKTAQINAGKGTAKDPVLGAHQTRINTAMGQLAKAAEIWKQSGTDEAYQQVKKFQQDVNDAQGDYEDYVHLQKKRMGGAPVTQPSGSPATDDGRDRASPGNLTFDSAGNQAAPINTGPIPQGATQNHDGSITMQGAKYERDHLNKGWRKVG